MASYSKLIKLLRHGERQLLLPKWGCSCSTPLSFSSTNQTTNQIFPAKSPSFSTKTPTPMFKEVSSSSPVATYFPEIFKLGMDRNIQEMETLCCKISLAEEGEEEAFHELLDSLVLNGKFKAALHIFDFIFTKKRDNLQQQSVIPTSSCCTSNHLARLNYFIRYLCNSDRVDLALHQFERMKHKNSYSPPNLKTFETLTFGLSAKAVVNEGLMLFDQLLELLDKTGRMHNPPFNRDFYAVVLSFLVKCNEPYKVSQLFRMMKDSGVEDYDIDQSHERLSDFYEIYLNTVRGFCYLWRFEDAAQFLDEHRFGTVRVPWSNDGYEELLKACCDAGMLDFANDLLDKMLKENISFACRLWKDIIRGYCQQDALDKAFDVLKEMITYWDQRIVCHSLCLIQTHGQYSCDETKNIHTLTDLIWHYSVHENHQFYGLALYAMLVTGIWKKGYKYEQVHCAAITDKRDEKNGFLKNMVKIGAGHVDYYAAHLKLLCQKGAMYEAFRDLKRMIRLWDTECANRTCSDQTSTDGLVPISESYLSLPDMILSSLNESSSKGDDVFLGLATYVMLTSGVWKEGNKTVAGKITWNGPQYVPELPEIKPVWKKRSKMHASNIPLNSGKLVPELPYVKPACHV